MGLKESGLRGSLRNVSVGIDAIPDKLILQPKEDDLNNFNGDTNEWDINGDDPVLFEDVGEGLSLKNTGSGGFIGSSSGLDNYPDVGETHVYFVNTNTTNGDPYPQVGWGHSDDNQQDDGYDLVFDFRDGGDDVILSRQDSGSGSTIDSESGFDSDTWYSVEILHESNGDITVTIREAGDLDNPQNYDDEDVVATLNGNDDTYITDGEYDNNGIYLRTITDADDTVEMWFID